MRILITLTPPLDPSTGGVQMSTVKLSRMLSPFGHEISVFSFANDGHIDQPTCEVVGAPFAGGVAEPRNLDALAAHLQRFKPDVTINQMPYEHPIGTVLRQYPAPALGCLRNTLYSVRNNLDAYAERSLPAAFVPLGKTALGHQLLLARHKRRHAADLRRILATYDRFVLFAEPNLEELRFFVPEFDLGSIVLIPNSIPDVAPEVPAKEKRILWLGRVTRTQKRADMILPLWERLAARLPDWEFDVVGDGDLGDALRREAAQKGIPRITFHGKQVSEPFFRRSAVFIMTSEFEGFPNTLVEAQSRGAVPVVFDSYPMASWLVSNDQNGALVKTGDLAAMEAAIMDLCTSPDKRERMAKAALISAEQFTEARVAGKWQSLLEEVVSSPRVATQ
ncbi:MAG: glycosyltransferase [Rhodobacteraceae bacterium]|nr:MAG: glycosyltransferase [Paracoccaceae bacterium]